MIRISVLSFLVWTVIGCADASADSPWPIASGDASAPECTDALRLARTMFDSGSARLYAPPLGLDKLASELVLQPTELDISGGYALQEDPKVFDQLPYEGGVRSIYWAKSVQAHARLAVQESSVGWRGDMYTLYLLPADMEPADFLAKIENPSTRPTAMISDEWRPPLVFSLKATRRLWFIDVGEPYTVLSSWQVYRVTAGPHDPVCTIQFRPTTPETVRLLPEAVATFAELIDETIGPGNNEGTLQPTARLRGAVQYVWGNVAPRPWAVSEADVYNSREEVDAGLEVWSKGGRSYRRVYKEILAAYPVALEALRQYYVSTFSLSEDKAQALATYVLDIALRANYAFTNGQDYFRYQGVNNNPWKQYD
jgi:hypothetical protein